MKKYFLLFLILILKCRTSWGNRRVIHGMEESDIQKFPYMIAVTNNYGPHCGGIIISEYWGLSAAHCFLLSLDKYIVISGTSFPFSYASNVKHSREDHRVLQCYKHELYYQNEGVEYGYDIAVFKVYQPFRYSSFTQPAKLPKIGQPLDMREATTTGWGCTEKNSMLSKVLRSVKISKVTDESCRSHYPYARGTLICYLGDTDDHALYRKDSCKGDSGGPLINKYGIVIGIVSVGTPYVTGYTAEPGGYTNVLFFRAWIKSKTGI